MKIEEMISANRADCTGCEACANACPQNAIAMLRDAEGFAYPDIDHALCKECGRCDDVCPTLNFVKKYPKTLPKIFAAINPDNKVRRHSSSGGVFGALSELILKDGGVIFGAGFDKDFHVVHKSARTLEELDNLRGSKYVQSQIGDVYRQVKDALKSTRVLFSGTPCQCAGLKSFLGKDYDNLLTVDVICQGVPSPAVWEYYIDMFSYAHEIKGVNFASKRFGWKFAHMEIDFADRESYLCPIHQDAYGGTYLCGLNGRPSCTACKFKFPNVQSDLTLGDALGVQDYAPDMFDERGTSIVLIHTPKGKDFFDRAGLRTQAVDFLNVVTRNPRLTTSAIADNRRKVFFIEFVKYTNRIANMKKYLEKDDVNIRQQISDKTQRALIQSYEEIFDYYRKNAERNILVVTPPLDDKAQEFLDGYFEKNLPDCGVYFMQLEGDGQLVCKEKMSTLTFELDEDPDMLTEFAKQFHVTEIFAENKVKYESPTLVKWINHCGLPANIFSLSAN